MCDQRVVIPYHLPADGEGRSAIAVTVLIGRTRAVARAEADGMAEGRNALIMGTAIAIDEAPAAADSGMGAVKAAMAGMESATVETAAAVEAATIAIAGGHRAGRQTRCKGHGHRAREKLLPHQSLLHPVHRQYKPMNQRRRRGTVASKAR